MKLESGLFYAILSETAIVGTGAYIAIGCLIPLIEQGYISQWVLWVYTIVSGLALLSHLMCWRTDAGSLDRSKNQDICVNLLSTEEPVVCPRCSQWKPLRTHHCLRCQSCILNMDHHCRWIANCVGLYTQKIFILFLCYTILASCLTIAIEVLYLFTLESPCGDLVTLALVLVLCLVSSASCFSILLHQIYGIKHNISPIDQLQLREFKKRSFKENLTEVFGSNWLFWIVPVPPKTYPHPVILLN